MASQEIFLCRMIAEAGERAKKIHSTQTLPRQCFLTSASVACGAETLATSWITGCFIVALKNIWRSGRMANTELELLNDAANRAAKYNQSQHKFLGVTHICFCGSWCSESRKELDILAHWISKGGWKKHLAEVSYGRRSDEEKIN